ncbi:UNVERIFIED_ORG: hypothetical protein FHR35_009133 [Microbispora rosea subsp. rosea]
MLVLPPTDLPGNTHHLSPTNPTFVTGAARYRLSWTGIVERSDPRFDALTEIFAGSHRPTDTFGVAGLESQEHSILWLGPADTVTRFEANPATGFPFTELNTHGCFGDRWPNTDAWLDFIPATTWNADGQGIVTEYAFDDGGQVVVYELLGRPALLSQGHAEGPRGLVPVVTFHCTRCHYEGDHHDRYMSAGPADRRAACRKARQHLRPGRCRGSEATSRADMMVAVVDQVVAGRPQPADTTGLYASRCQTSELRCDEALAHSTCAEIREARKHTARHRMAAGAAE